MTLSIALAETSFITEVPAWKGGPLFNNNPGDWKSLWTDCGVSVSSGTPVSVQAEGAWTWDAADFVGPQGQFESGNPQDLFFKNSMRAQLIAYVGDLGSDPPTSGYVAIGSFASFTAPQAGRLWLAFNDDNANGKKLSDNLGSVWVQINIGTTITGVPCGNNPVMFEGGFAGNAFSMNGWGPAQTTWSVYSSDDSRTWTLRGSATFPSTHQLTPAFVDQNIPAQVTNRFYKFVSSGGCCSQPYGFMLQKVPRGQMNLAANQLWSYPNTLDQWAIGNDLQNYTQVMKWNNNTSGFDTYTRINGAWSPSGAVTFEPGEGAFICNTNTDVTWTFIGWVRETAQAGLPVPLTVGVSGEAIISSMVPQRGGVTTFLKLNPATDGDTVLLYNGTGYDSYTYFGGAWAPREPIIGIGQGFFYDTSSHLSWTRQFRACP